MAFLKNNGGYAEKKRNNVFETYDNNDPLS